MAVQAFCVSRMIEDIFPPRCRGMAEDTLPGVMVVWCIAAVAANTVQYRLVCMSEADREPVHRCVAGLTGELVVIRRQDILMTGQAGLGKPGIALAGMAALAIHHGMLPGEGKEGMGHAWATRRERHPMRWDLNINLSWGGWFLPSRVWVLPGNERIRFPRLAALPEHHQKSTHLHLEREQQLRCGAIRDGISRQSRLRLLENLNEHTAKRADILGLTGCQRLCHRVQGAVKFVQSELGILGIRCQCQVICPRIG